MPDIPTNGFAVEIRQLTEEIRQLTERLKPKPEGPKG